MSRSAVTSSPASNRRSKSRAFIDGHFLTPRPSHRNDPHAPVSVGDNRRPMFLADLADDEESRLVFGAGWNLDVHLVEPECLGIDKIDPVLLLIGPALLLVKLEVHCQARYNFGRESILCGPSRGLAGRIGVWVG